MSEAGSETASSMPRRSTIEPRRAGTLIRSTCCVVAACLSELALTVPSHVAFRPANASRPRKTAKSRPMRRWIRGKEALDAGRRGQCSRERRSERAGASRSPSRLLGRGRGGGWRGGAAGGAGGRGRRLLLRLRRLGGRGRGLRRGLLLRLLRRRRGRLRRRRSRSRALGRARGRDRPRRRRGQRARADAGGLRLGRGARGQRDRSVATLALAVATKERDRPGGRRDESQPRGLGLEAVVGAQPRDGGAQVGVLAVEQLGALDRAPDAGVELEQRDLHEDDADQRAGEQRDPRAAGEQALEERMVGERGGTAQRAAAERWGADGPRPRQRDGAPGGDRARARRAGGAGYPARRYAGGRCTTSAVAAGRGGGGGWRAHRRSSVSGKRPVCLRAARRRADAARGVWAISSGEGVTPPRASSAASALRPQAHTGRSGGHTQPFARSARNRFTRRSSREWNEIPANRPSEARSAQASGSARSSWSSSPLTAMRMAWKVRLAGWPPAKRAGAGTERLMTSTSSCVVSSGRLRTIARAIWLA